MSRDRYYAAAAMYLTTRGVEPTRQGLQHHIAVVVSVGVVHLLKVVYIERNYADRLAILDTFVTCLASRLGVGESGHRLKQCAIKRILIQQTSNYIVAGIEFVECCVLTTCYRGGELGSVRLSNGRAEIGNDYRVHAIEREVCPCALY